MIFFFSSRRRHTRLQGDWSSDVCSSDLDLQVARPVVRQVEHQGAVAAHCTAPGVRSEERRVGKSVDLGGRRIIKKKKKKKPTETKERVDDTTLAAALEEHERAGASDGSS